jgi:DedD protein
MSDDESRGVHLSDKQLVFVFMAATVAAVVVFLFGVLVGRGVQQARGPVPGGETAAAASQVLPDGTPAEAPVADGVPRQGSGAAGADEYTYPARLGKTPPEEQLKARPGSAADVPGESAPPDVPFEPVAPGPKPPGASAPRPTAPAMAASTPGASVAAAPTPGPAAAAPYTVQVAAVKDRQEADGIAKQLKAKGYDAYVFAPDGGDAAGVFRVRIGSFKERRQAELLAERLLREEKRYKPWVTR